MGSILVVKIVCSLVLFSLKNDFNVDFRFLIKHH